MNVPLKLLKLKLIVKLPLLVRLNPLKSASTGQTPKRSTKHQQPTRNMFRALHDLLLLSYRSCILGPLSPRSRAVVCCAADRPRREAKQQSLGTSPE